MHGILVESLSTSVNVPPQENKHQLGFTRARNLFCPNVEQKETTKLCVKLLPSFAATLMHILLLCRFHRTASLEQLRTRHRHSDAQVHHQAPRQRFID